jgi:hypothetical protein
MKTLEVFLIFFVSTAYSKSQFNDFLTGTSCVTKAHERGVCTYYTNCQHLREKVNNRQISLDDIFKCNSQGIICCVPDVPANTTLSPTSKTDDGSLLQPRGMKVGKISEESK